MAIAGQRDGDKHAQQVRVSNAASNMISSLHPFDKPKANATLARIKSSVLDPTNVKKIAGVDNAFVARSGDLRVVFTNEGDSFVITSIVTKA